MATSTVPVHPSNREQLRAWDGDEGAYWAEHGDYFDRSVAAYHEQLLATAAITPTERVLDIGCGTGQTTRTPPAPRTTALPLASTSRRGCSTTLAAGPPRKA